MVSMFFLAGVAFDCLLYSSSWSAFLSVSLKQGNQIFLPTMITEMECDNGLQPEKAVRLLCEPPKLLRHFLLSVGVKEQLVLSLVLISCKHVIFRSKEGSGIAHCCSLFVVVSFTV